MLELAAMTMLANWSHKILRFNVFVRNELWASFRYEGDARDFMLFLLKNNIESRLEYKAVKQGNKKPV